MNLRDDKEEINHPNEWDLIGGVVEEGETPDECMAREIYEETGERQQGFSRFRMYRVPLDERRAAEFHVYYGRLDKPASALVVGEGQEHRFFALDQLRALSIVPWVNRVLSDFVASPQYQQSILDGGSRST